MGLYTRALFEKHTQAVEAARMCVSAAVAGSHYRGRLTPYLADYLDIVEFFEPDSEAKDVARVFYALVRGEHFGGFVVHRIEEQLARVDQKLKGKLLGTRMILSDGNKKPKCLKPKEHTQPCRCKNLMRARLAAQMKEEPNVSQ